MQLKQVLFKVIRFNRRNHLGFYIHLQNNISIHLILILISGDSEIRGVIFHGNPSENKSCDIWARLVDKFNLASGRNYNKNQIYRYRQIERWIVTKKTLKFVNQINTLLDKYRYFLKIKINSYFLVKKSISRVKMRFACPLLFYVRNRNSNFEPLFIDKP